MSATPTFEVARVEVVANKRRKCPGCGHKNPMVITVDRKSQWVNDCQKCGTSLAGAPVVGDKSKPWMVIERRPGKKPKHHKPAKNTRASAEALRDRLIGQHAENPLHDRVIDRVANVVRSIRTHGDDGTPRTEADVVAILIERLGGKAPNASLESIAFDSFIAQQVASIERRSTGVQVERNLKDFAAITGVQMTGDVNFKHAERFKATLRSGQWKRPGTDRPVKKNDRTLRTTMQYVRAALQRGVSAGFIDPEVIQRGNWKHGAADAQPESMTVNDFSALVNAAAESKHPRWWVAYLTLGVDVAARRNEPLLLTWDDVDLTGENAERHGLPHGTPTATITREKAKGHRRDTLPLHPNTVAVLAALKRHPDALVCRYQPKQAGAISEHVFPILGHKRPETRVNREFAALCVEAGLVDADGKARYSPKTLRLFSNNEMSKRGASEKELMAHAGHTSAKVNRTHYQRADADRLVELVNNNAALTGAADIVARIA